VSAGADERLIGFRIGGTRAALPLGVVRQVMERPTVVRVPGSRPYVSGVALQDGIAVPVYDLGRFGPLWPEPRSEAWAESSTAVQLIVCEWGETPLGLLGDRVDILMTDGNTSNGPAVSEPPGGMCRSYVKQIVRVNGEAIALLDADRLFASLGVPAAGPRGRRGPGEDDPAGG
jgi:chemotaxis signal transduction protein